MDGINIRRWNSGLLVGFVEREFGTVFFFLRIRVFSVGGFGDGGGVFWGETGRWGYMFFVSSFLGWDGV